MDKRHPDPTAYTTVDLDKKRKEHEGAALFIKENALFGEGMKTFLTNMNTSLAALATTIATIPDRDELEKHGILDGGIAHGEHATHLQTAHNNLAEVFDKLMGLELKERNTKRSIAFDKWRSEKYGAVNITYNATKEQTDE